jgi:Subtilase family
MTPRMPIRLVLELPNEPNLLERYRSGNHELLREYLAIQFNIRDVRYAITDLPSLAFHFRFRASARVVSDEPRRRRVEDALAWLVLGLAFETLEDARAFMDQPGLRERARIGTNVSVAPLESWCPQESAPSFFQTRALAHAQIGAAALTAQTTPLRGQGVNIVVVDEGLPFLRLGQVFPTADLVGGWYVEPPGVPPRWPGEAQPGGHGGMVARNVLSLAPHARVFDLPVIPPRMLDVTGYMAWIGAAFWYVRAELTIWLSAAFPGPWVFCNAWGIYDLRLESIPGDYTRNRLHPFTRQVTEMEAEGRDFIFGAGNCGQFCPDNRCGPGDRGIGKSIWGANSSPKALTVGAVRADGLWLGYSSQGPGQADFITQAPPGATQVEKPDLCLPSHFVEVADALSENRGTSAACGLAAGAVAALRSGAPLAGHTPEQLREHLRQTARRPAGVGWNERKGYGILDLDAALPP